MEKDAMIDQSLVLRQKSGIEYITLDDGSVVKIHDTIHVLNHTASQIFELCAGRRSIGEIVREMESRYPEDAVSVTVYEFIGILSDSGLVHE